MTTILIKEQSISLPDENVELYKNLLKLLKVSCSIRVGHDENYTINDLINDLPYRTAYKIKAWVSYVDNDDFNKDCLYFVTHYSMLDFAKMNNVGKKTINEVVETLKLHGYEWPEKKLPNDYRKYDAWYYHRD